MYVAIRDGMLAYMNQNPYQAMKELEIYGVEIEVDREYKTPNFSGNNGHPFNLLSEKEVLLKELEENRTKICALLMHNNFDTGDIKEEIKWVINTCRIAKDLGVNTIRIDLATHSENTEPDTFISSVTPAVREILSATKDTGVSLAMENHGILANKKEFLDKILKKVNSERLGITLDSGNFYWYGYPLDEVYNIMLHFAKKVKHTHIKNISYPPEKRNSKREIGWEYGKYVSPIYEGDIDHQKVISILREVGYNGPLTIEDESLGKFPKEEQKEILKKDVTYLKEFISQIATPLLARNDRKEKGWKEKI